ncbi:MAG: aspartyl protease family protein [Alphaproteobacteria bacterium]|nr:aspartyl protease family protein [Alphaproteobacteria bacterium]MBU1512757.1 aspartyl protease family protein [Alphaproteobacteria bacterium]MBU2096136.1 aspartyl protease family protein [Alphaproteobacteria bacterium]MBU2152832.1 aspartyl protease family protein [Alphaproteobacteria bacterium]MBU2307974.1 aspartyl protease family protein [Alphaproteobacteria bacterium]
MTMDRRHALQTLLVGGLASACATAPKATAPLVSINLADVQPPIAPATGTRLETAFDQAQRMTVPVRLGDRGPFQFVVDTGANHTVISVETAQRCGLAGDGVAPVHGIVGTQPAPLVKAPMLRVGQVRSTNLSLPTLPKAALGADGLLGIDVLRNRRIRLNFRANSFEIGPSGKGASVVQLGGGGGSRIPDPARGIVVPAQYRSGQLVIFDADVAGVPVRAFLDSGAQITCGNEALRQVLVRERPELAEGMQSTRLISATGQTSPAQLAPLSRLRLGGMALNNIRAAFAPLHIFSLWGLNDRPAMLVGIDVLRHFDEVNLDFGRREVTFIRARNTRAA